MYLVQPLRERLFEAAAFSVEAAEISARRNQNKLCPSWMGDLRTPWEGVYFKQKIKNTRLRSAHHFCISYNKCKCYKCL